MSNQLREQLLREAVITEARHLRDRVREYLTAIADKESLADLDLRSLTCEAAMRRVANAVDKLEEKG